MKTITILLKAAATGALCIAGSAALTEHANPWAGEDDEVNAQFHDTNQARSVDTPGEDEMNGVMTQSAHGKLDTAPSTDRSADTPGASADAGASSNSGNGNRAGAGNGSGAGNGNGDNGGGQGRG